MAIPEEDVARVRAATDLAALVGEHTALRRVGRRLIGLCPFHSERTPSFSVNAEQGLYYCFGCQASGDAISFVRAVEGCDFREAVERLAARAGIAIRDEAGARAPQERGRRERLHEVLEAAVDHYHRVLLDRPEARRARQYLRARGYSGETVRRFRLGFAPAGRDGLVRALRRPGDLLVEAGLAYRSSAGLYDAFRERLIFPIFDPGGRPIALGGRVLPPELRIGGGDPGPKYRNSPESAIYHKRRTLYGLNWAKSEITRSGEAIVCEGYTDVIGFFEAGLPRAVATCGTALTEDHLALLARFARRVVLCFDADRAGQAAAARLYEWEGRHGLELAVAALPEGSDPADLARADPEALVAAVRSARPYLRFLVEQALAEAAVATIAQHPNGLVRDQYLAAVADRTHHDLAALRALLERRRRSGDGREREPSSGGRGRAGTAAPGARRRDARPGLDALALAIQRPEAVAGLLDEVCFLDPLQRRAFRALSEATELHAAIAAADEEVADLLRRLAATEVEAEADGTVIALVRVAAEHALDELETEARLAEQDGDAARVAEATATNAWLKGELPALSTLLERPDERARGLESARRLVAWLRDREEGRR